MDFNTPSKTPLQGAGLSKPKNPQQLVGGCKKSLGSPSISSRAARRTQLSAFEEFKTRNKNTSPMGHSFNNSNNENCQPSPLKKQALLHPRGHAMVEASMNRTKNNPLSGIWHMGQNNHDNNNNSKSEQSSRSSIFSEDPIIVSNNFNTSTLRTYSKINTPRKVEMGKSTAGNSSNGYMASSKVGTSSRVNAIACLPLNSSVTVTAVPSNTQSSCSLRKLKFDENSSTSRVPFDDDDDDEENVLFQGTSAKKFKRQPLTPIRPALKSSILSDISPNKIDKAYGLVSSPTSEKENVPFVEVENIALPHLLGFPNLGNTCYLNAVLQSLVGVRVFRCDVSSCVQGLGCSVPPSTLLSALTQLLAARKTGLTHNLRQPLRNMKENFEKLDSNFIGWKMQDANEFLTKILDTMKDEVDKLTCKVKCEGFEPSAVGCLALDNEVSSSTHQDSGSSPLSWSPFKPNVPKILNNSVEIRSLAPQDWGGETITDGGSKKMERSCSPVCSNGSSFENANSCRDQEEKTFLSEAKESQKLRNGEQFLSSANGFKSSVNDDEHSCRYAAINNGNPPISNGNNSADTNGSHPSTTNSNHSPGTNDSHSPLPNASYLRLVNGNDLPLTNGKESPFTHGKQSPIMNGRYSPTVNGKQSSIDSGTHSLLHDEGVQSADADGYSASSFVLTNGSCRTLSSETSALMPGAERRAGSARSRRPSASPSGARKRLRAVDIARKRKLSSALQAFEQNIVVNPITANFGFQLHEIYRCLGCGERLKRSQDYFSLYVHLSPSSCDDEEGEDSVGPATIRDAVNNYMKQEEREVKCEHCSHPTAMVNTRFTKMPRILIIQVKRYTYSAAQYSSLKVSSSIGVNKRLDLSPYTERDTSPYPAVTGEPVRSAPPTPCKMTAPATPTKTALQRLRQNGVATLSSCPSVEANASPTTEGESSTSEDKTNSLTEDEQLQEALRRSLEDNVATGSSCDDPQTIVLGDEEEDDLQRAIRLSLLDAQQQQETENSLTDEAPAADGNEQQQAHEKEEEDEEDCSGPHSYTLASIVSHFGRNTTAGHYTSDVLSEAGRAWLHYDDESVTEVPQSTVLGDSRQRNGYIFFYVHRDLLSTDC